MGALPAWVLKEHDNHQGMCTYCQRHFKVPSNWASHIARNHERVWKNLADRHGVTT